MGRIGASLSGVERALLNRLSEAQAAVTLHNFRRATGQKINAPRDNPTGFVDVSQLRTRLKTVTATSANVAAASSLVSQTQLVLDQIRSQLELIRTKAAEDENQGLMSNQRAANQAAIDAAIVEINRLATSEIAGRRVLDGSANYRFSGLNPSQVADLRVFRAGGAAPVVAGEAAELTYTGAAGKIAANATLTLGGRTGSRTLTVTTSDTLADVVARINESSTVTEVAARLDGNQIKLQSASTGSTSKVEVDVSAGSFAVAGGDGAGLDYGVDSVLGTGPAISGRVDRTATQAKLTYSAGGANIAANATFTLGGQLGSTSISVTTADTLGDAAARINLKSHLTGVTAAVDGTTIVFSSVGFGTKATAEISVTSGTFAVTGANGDGTAEGTNAVATINGRTISGNAAAVSASVNHQEATGTIAGNATVALTGSLGTANVSFTAGQTLVQARDAVNLESANTGVIATVDADNLNLILTDTATGEDSIVQVEVTAGSFGVSAGAGLAPSELTPRRAAQLIHATDDGTIAANANLTITGTLGSSTPIGITAGQTIAQVRDLVNAQSGATGVVASISGNQLYLTSSTQGPGAEVSVVVNSGTFATSGGDGEGTDFGTNESTTVRGLDAVTDSTAVDGNRFTVNQGGAFYTIEFAAGFEGAFHTIEIEPGALEFALYPDLTATSVLAIPGLQASRLGGLSGQLDQIASGGAYAGLNTNTSRALRIIDESLGDLTRIEGAVDGFANSAIESSSALMSALETNLEDSIDAINKANPQEEDLLIEKNEALVSNALAGLAVLANQRMSIVDLIRRLAGLP